MGIKIGNVLQIKAGTVARTDTTSKAVFTLPANAMVIGVRAFGVNSDSATSATLTLESRPISSSTVTTFATVNAKATAAGATAATLAGIAFARQAEPVQVTVKYSEVGAASTGGSWTVAVEYL